MCDKIGETIEYLHSKIRAHHNQQQYDMNKPNLRCADSVPAFSDRAPSIQFQGIKDSGERQHFATGSQRDTQQGKGRPSLAPTLVLRRWFKWFELGAGKYEDRNWEKGQPLSRYYDSAMRHLTAAFDGETDEDHEAAALWNIGGFMWTKYMVEAGELSPELDDRPRYRGKLMAEVTRRHSPPARGPVPFNYPSTVADIPA